MQLEQTLEMYPQMQRAIPERQRVYTNADLEYLSASVLYSGEAMAMRRMGIGPGCFSGMLRFGPKGLKIFEDSTPAPLVRLDYSAHHGLPKMHLQYGKEEFSGRSGNEAAEIFAAILTKNVKIQFPGIFSWVNEENKQKDKKRKK